MLLSKSKDLNFTLQKKKTKKILSFVIRVEEV